MTPERWRQIEQIFHTACEKSDSEMAAYLDRACGNDSDLRKEVESLLDQNAGETSPFHTLVSSATHSMEQQPESLIGTRIGPYRITEMIGAGGMAEVFKAVRDDDQYRSEVAIKLIKRGMASEFLLQRFRHERQILATLEHPNIAQMLDGGTTEGGLPYFVMAYTSGEPITEYCRKENLNVKQKLKLFLSVCDAVQYAHRQLIVHRDLKPSNILVNREGVPKLLDFGLAKILAPDADPESENNPMTVARLMTPEYASPEQVHGEPVTTATDVYSLGTVLYEMVTGQRAHQLNSRSFSEIERVVCFQEPEKPSEAITRKIPDEEGSPGSSRTPFEVQRLRRELAGDLDNIILMALRKEPSRRYLSVEQFAEDIRRSLESRPVIARTSTVLYRADKFMKRHKAGVTAAVLISLSLVAGLFAINQQRLRAEQRFQEVRKLAHAFVFDYHDAIADLPGSRPVRQRLVKDALTYLDSLSKEAKDDASLQRELATTYVKIGDIQGNSNTENLGDLTGAMASYQKALKLRQNLAAAQPQNSDLQSELAKIHMRIGNLLADMSSISNAYDSYQKALVILEMLAKTNPSGTDVQQDLAEAYFRIGDLKGNPYLPSLGDLSAGLEYHRKALAMLQKLTFKNSQDAELKSRLVNSFRTLAGMLIAAGNLPEAERMARDGLKIAEQLNAESKSSVRAVKALGNARESLSRVLMVQEKWDEALAILRQILASDQSFLSADPRNVQARRYVTMDYSQIGSVLSSQGNFPSALEYFRKSLELDQELADADPNNNRGRYEVSLDHLSIGEMLEQMGDLHGAETSQLKAVLIQEELTKKDPNDVQAALNLAVARDRYSETLAKLGRSQDALEGFRKGVQPGEQALREDSSNDRAKRQLAIRYFHIADILMGFAAKPNAGARKAQYFQEARSAYQNSLNLMQQLQKNGSLPAEFADRPRLAAEKIAQCDKALAPHPS